MGYRGPGPVVEYEGHHGKEAMTPEPGQVVHPKEPIQGLSD